MDLPIARDRSLRPACGHAPTPRPARSRAVRLPSAAAVLTLGLALPSAAAAQAAERAAAPPPGPVSVSFEGSSLRDVAAFFARWAGRSIVVGAGVDGVVTAEIERQPWDVAFAAILAAHGLVGRELESGIILVGAPGPAVEMPGVLATRIFRLSYLQAAEVQPAVQSMLSERGSVGVVPSANALVVTDEARVLAGVAALLGGE